jgi:carbonic anhydrase
MNAIHQGCEQVPTPHLRKWLKAAVPALEKLKALPRSQWKHEEHNELSKMNVLLQMEHLMSYSIVRERVMKGTLQIHGWWFEIAQANVHAYDPDKQVFQIIEENEAERLLKRLDLGRSRPL